MSCDHLGHNTDMVRLIEREAKQRERHIGISDDRKILHDKFWDKFDFKLKSWFKCTSNNVFMASHNYNCCYCWKVKANNFDLSPIVYTYENTQDIWSWIKYINIFKLKNENCCGNKSRCCLIEHTWKTYCYVEFWYFSRVESGAENKKKQKTSQLQSCVISTLYLTNCKCTT